MKAEEIYRRLPVGLQNAACSLEGLRIRRSRYNRDFWARLQRAELRATQTHREVEAFRDTQLAEFVNHAATTVPYYRELFARIGAEPGDIRKLDDLALLPVLTKAQVQADATKFLSDAVPVAQRVSCHTSGTTGAGLEFFSTADAEREQYAMWWRYLHWHGLEFGTWCAYFGGRSVVPVGQRTPPFWRTSLPLNMVLFSGYHTSPENLDLYLRKLRDARPPWLHGYPSQLTLIATHLLETKFDLGYRPRWITIGAESLLGHQRKLIRDAFGVDPIQHYGMAEAVGNISQCPQGQLHVDEDYAAVEFLPAGDDGLCKIVGTNFSNRATPLLRYELGDHVSVSSAGCDCGRPGRVVEYIDGRKEAYIELANGVRFGRLDHIFKDLVNVREAQIRQTVVGAIEVLVVKGAGFGDGDEARLLREFRSRLGDELQITVRYVDRIDRTGAGKLRFVVSELQHNRVNA